MTAACNVPESDERGGMVGPFDSIPRPKRPSDGTHYIN